MKTYADRKPILAQIEAARGSKAIMYVTGDRPGMETQVSPEVGDIFVDHLDAMWEAAPPIKKLSLILHTKGGDTAAAWQIINLLRTFCDDLEVIVPFRALSAGTLISLGANRIVMTKQASLGPIDPSLNHPLGPLVPGGVLNQTVPVSVEAVQGYLDVVKDQLKVGDAAALANVWNNLSDKIHPLVLGQIFRARSQIRTLAKRLLNYQDLDDAKKEEIISFLCRESGSHDHTINRREAKIMGLTIEHPSADLYSTIRALHTSVAEDLKLSSPYSPDTELGQQQVLNYSLSRALIETVDFGSHQFISEGILARVAVQWPNGMQQTGMQDSRTFEAWRKVA